MSDYDYGEPAFEFDYGDGSAWPTDFVTVPMPEPFSMPADSYTMRGLGIDESGFGGLGGLGIIDALISKNRADKEREHRKREDAAMAARLAELEQKAGINPNVPAGASGGIVAAPPPSSPLPKVALVVGGLVGLAVLVRLVRR